jgi:hypothetical protein
LIPLVKGNWMKNDAGEVDPNDFRTFYSNNAFHPQLTMSYIAAPEPGTLTLLVVGGSAWGLIAWRRRRQFNSR